MENSEQRREQTHPVAARAERLLKMLPYRSQEIGSPERRFEEIRQSLLDICELPGSPGAEEELDKLEQEIKILLD